MDKVKEYIELIMDKFGEHRAVVVFGVIILGFIVVAAVTG